MTHTHPIRVYYEDTDAAGLVYYANYLKFAERGRTEYLRALGFENSGLREMHGIAFVVRHLEADYLKPGFLDDALAVQTEILSLKKASFVMNQTIIRPQKNAAPDTLFDMQVTLACITMPGGKPTALPKSVYDVFSLHGASAA